MTTRRGFLAFLGVGALGAAGQKRRRPTAMSEWTPAQFQEWSETMRRNAGEQTSRSAAEVLALVERCSAIEDGSGVTQKEHCLQTATRALRAGADEELVVAALLHDAGKLYDGMNHAAIAAEILRPHVSRETYEVVRNHTTFEARFYGAHLGPHEPPDRSCVAPVYACIDPAAYRNMERETWYALAMRFTGEWDQRSFDPGYDTLPLAYFEPMVRRIFGRRSFALAAPVGRRDR
jgi:predicted HD phosphohydrolase